MEIPRRPRYPYPVTTQPVTTQPVTTQPVTSLPSGFSLDDHLNENPPLLGADGQVTGQPVADPGQVTGQPVADPGQVTGQPVIADSAFPDMARQPGVRGLAGTMYYLADQTLEGSDKLALPFQAYDPFSSPWTDTMNTFSDFNKVGRGIFNYFRNPRGITPAQIGNAVNSVPGLVLPMLAEMTVPGTGAPVNNAIDLAKAQLDLLGLVSGKPFDEVVGKEILNQKAEYDAGNALDDHEIPTLDRPATELYDPTLGESPFPDLISKPAQPPTGIPATYDPREPGFSIDPPIDLVVGGPAPLPATGTPATFDPAGPPQSLIDLVVSGDRGPLPPIPIAPPAPSGGPVTYDPAGQPQQLIDLVIGGSPPPQPISIDPVAGPIVPPLLEGSASGAPAAVPPRRPPAAGSSTIAVPNAALLPLIPLVTDDDGAAPRAPAADVTLDDPASIGDPRLGGAALGGGAIGGLAGLGGSLYRKYVLGEDVGVGEIAGSTLVGAGEGAASEVGEELVARGLSTALGIGAKGASLASGGLVEGALAGITSTFANREAVASGDMTAAQGTANVAVDAGVGLASGLAGAATGAAIGSFVPVAGTAVGAGLGFAGGALMGLGVNALAEYSGFNAWAKEGLGEQLGFLETPLDVGWGGVNGGIDGALTGAGVGAMGGAAMGAMSTGATGAAIGALAGPMGMLVGGALGAGIGAVGGGLLGAGIGIVPGAGIGAGMGIAEALNRCLNGTEAP